MKYSKVSGVVHWSGGSLLLHEGLSADDDHPLVLERPDLWVDEMPAATLRTHKPEHTGPPAVERATRAPGERRPTKRTQAQQPVGDGE